MCGSFHLSLSPSVVGRHLFTFSATCSFQHGGLDLWVSKMHPRSWAEGRNAVSSSQE